MSEKFWIGQAQLGMGSILYFCEMPGAWIWSLAGIGLLVLDLVDFLREAKRVKDLKSRKN